MRARARNRSWLILFPLSTKNPHKQYERTLGLGQGLLWERRNNFELKRGSAVSCNKTSKLGFPCFDSVSRNSSKKGLKPQDKITRDVQTLFAPDCTTCRRTACLFTAFYFTAILHQNTGNVFVSFSVSLNQTLM